MLPLKAVEIEHNATATEFVQLYAKSTVEFSIRRRVTAFFKIGLQFGSQEIVIVQRVEAVNPLIPHQASAHEAPSRNAAHFVLSARLQT